MRQSRLKYILIRSLHALVVILFVCVITFIIIHNAPGGPAIMMNPESTAEDVARFRASLGLDEPVPVQLLRWLGNLARGDLGRSINHGLPVTRMIGERIVPTLLLAGSALLLAVVIGVPLGILSAKRSFSLLDSLISFVSYFGISIPGFWLGIMLIALFSVRLQVLPSAGMATIGEAFSLRDRIAHLLMPSFVLSLFLMAQVIQYARASMLAVLHQPYVMAARAKGLSEWTVTYRHMLRNALIPIITAIGLQIPRLVGGSVIIEKIFGWPGMGRLAVDAASTRDYPLVMGITVIVSVVVILANLLVDILYGYVDPRIRLE